MEYTPSKVELQFMNKVLAELDNYRMLSQVEKAYYIYYRFCQFYRKKEKVYRITLFFFL